MTEEKQVATYIVQEEAPDPAQERPIHGSDSSSQERPLTTTIMWYRRVWMVKKRDHYNPVIGQLGQDQYLG